MVQFHEQKHTTRAVVFSGVAKRLAGEDKGSQKPALIIQNGMGGSPTGPVFEPCLPVTCCTYPFGHPDGHAADYRFHIPFDLESYIFAWGILVDGLSATALASLAMIASRFIDFCDGRLAKKFTCYINVRIDGACRIT